MQKVIIDVGVHKGEDSDFYLHKGFKVIGVEASDKLCEEVLDKFKNHPCKENFTLLNYAITDKDNELITLYENTDKSPWNTIFETWDVRNKAIGTNSIKKTVKTIRLDTLIKRELINAEQLEYIKIDIEGADTLALKSLYNISERPKFISIESESESWDKLLEEFSILKKLGYKKFKVVDQSKIRDQQSLYISKEGETLNYKFDAESSGLFGDELPGEWLSEQDAIKMYKKIFRQNKYFGNNGIFNNRVVRSNKIIYHFRKMFNLKFPHIGWYDTHATF